VWESSARFALAFHPIQVLPFFLGFVLIGGFTALVAALHASAPPELRARTSTALLFAAAFAALIGLNYIAQTTFVPGLARAYRPEHDAAIAAFSMSSPISLAWALEMWGYGFLGVATWLVAPVLRETPRERLTAWIFVANGPLSVIPALLTAFLPGWVLTPIGFVSFLVWNVLAIALGITSWLVFGARLQAAADLLRPAPDLATRAAPKSAA
jgi:hypothetical protein